MTHLRKIMLEDLERRNYARTTIDCYIRTVEHFASISADLPISWVPITCASTRSRCLGFRERSI